MKTLPSGPNSVTVEQLRRQILSIRQVAAIMMEQQDFSQHNAIFYSGYKPNDEPFFHAFKTYLGARGYPNGIWLGATEAGRFLSAQHEEFLKNWLTDTDTDWSTPITLLDEYGSFTVSLIGFWRELSARYAKKVHGVVHLLIGQDRKALLAEVEDFWKWRATLHAEPMKLFLEGHPFIFKAVLKQLEEQRKKNPSSPLGATVALVANAIKVLGMAEWPVLCQRVSSNKKVNEIKVYTASTQATPRFLEIGRIDPATGRFTQNSA